MYIISKVLHGPWNKVLLNKVDLGIEHQTLDEKCPPGMGLWEQ